MSSPSSKTPSPLAWLYGAWASFAFAVCVLLVFCPLLIIAPTLALRREIARFGMRATLFCMGIPFRVHGVEHIPPGTAIAVSNHCSYLDGLVLNAALPRRYTFLIQHGAAGWPYAGLVLRRLKARFVNREDSRDGAAQTRALLKLLRDDGESVAIFAEGTFSQAPGLLPFKNGAFLLAAKAKLPVLPVGIRGTRAVLGPSDRLLRWHPIDIEFGEPIAAGTDVRAMRDLARARVLALCGEPDSVGATAADDTADIGKAIAKDIA